MRFVRLLFICLILFIFGACINYSEIKNADYIKILPQNNKKIITYHGTIKSQSGTDLSFQAEGEIIFLPYTKGDYVKKGTIIARLDGTLYSIKRSEEMARLQEYSIRKQKQNNYYKRLDLLHKVGAISENDWEGAFFELETLNKQYEIQKEKIKYLDEEISYNVIISPYDAYISEKYSDVNSYAKKGETIVSIIGLNDLQAEIMIDELKINQITLDENLNIKILDKNYKGIVKHISKSSVKSGGYLVKINLLNPDDNIKEGMSADISIPIKNNLPILPLDSIIQENGESYVFKIENIKNNIGIIQKNKIKIGKIIDENIEVIDGIKNGDFIIAKNLSEYYPNQKVKI